MPLIHLADVAAVILAASVTINAYLAIILYRIRRRQEARQHEADIRADERWHCDIEHRLATLERERNIHAGGKPGLRVVD